MTGVEWNVTLPESGQLDFEASGLHGQRGLNFPQAHAPRWQSIRCANGRPLGYSVTFSVPKPMSRLSLVDLVAGKAVNSEQVEAHMRPLAVLGDGASVLMVGAGDDRRRRRNARTNCRCGN